MNPLASLGVNLSGPNLFSQISSKIESGKISAANLPDLSEIDPMESLGNAIGPLNNIREAVSGRLKSLLNSRGTGLPGPLKSSLESSLTGSDTSEGVGVVKSSFILIARISVAVLEIVLWLLRGALGFLT